MHTHKLSVSSSIHHHWENRSLFRNTSCSHDQYCQPSSSCPHILCHYVTVGEATQSHHFSPFSVPFHLLRSSLFSLLHHLCLPPQFQQNTKAILTLRGLQASLDSTAASGYPLFLCPLVSRNSWKNCPQRTPPYFSACFIQPSNAAQETHSSSGVPRSHRTVETSTSPLSPPWLLAVHTQLELSPPPYWHALYFLSLSSFVTTSFAGSSSLSELGIWSLLPFPPFLHPCPSGHLRPSISP